MIRGSGRLTARALEDLYSEYNHRRFVHPDPLELLYDYADVKDREIAALIASSLAYGRVRQILKSASTALGIIGSPLRYALGTSRAAMRRHFRGFAHRFTTGDEVASMIFAAGRAIERHGSLEECFAAGLDPGDDTVERALLAFARELRAAPGGGCPSLIPDPARGSACKRLNLMLRWMVRRDAVDPGGWDGVGPRRLIVPLDTHMHRVALGHGLTERRSADMRTALEVTAAFARFSSSDPVRYDFALTRPGIGGH